MTEPHRPGDPEATADARAGEPTGNTDAPTLGRAFAQAASGSGLRAIGGADAPTGRALFEAMGGIRGLCETILPGLVFLIPYTILTSIQEPWAQQWAMPVSLGASVLVALVFTLVRVVTKTQVTQAVAGLIGVAASAILALITGNAANNFVLGFVIDAAYAAAMLVSLLVRWPLLGLVIGYLMGDGVAWRASTAKRRAMQVLTLCWFALFAVRLAVQLPLYFAGLTVALGFTKLLMGVPLYATLVLVSWLVARAVYPQGQREHSSED
ncbi:DUF3159 domain-containing protein [Humibacter sp.]|uniref:DUF3159 domain-containing protein n=1 Tax=Humibacter sp. TaxID=1940291 RepID=UPI002C40883F|nr:DUF3159 domain-containing protein [Humibacter sp.]HVX07228.1 DUF3159 domain-containing protein [Humibacter sp.]